MRARSVDGRSSATARGWRDRVGRPPRLLVRRALCLWPPPYLTPGLALGLAVLLGPRHPIGPWAVAAQGAFLGI